jgi:transglutaminase-like putative cysteine protease
MSRSITASASAQPHAGSASDAGCDVAALPATLRIGCRFDFETAAETAVVTIVEPHESERDRVVDEEFVAPGGAESTTYIDGFGNRCRRMTLPPGQSSFRYRARVRNDAGFDVVDLDACEVAPRELPDDTLTFLLPSRFCPSDELATVAFERFGSTAPGWGRVDAIAAWANEHLTFAYGSSAPTKTAADAIRDRSGVCRDFAHLSVTMCRALNIPARYVVGYLPDIAVPDPGTPMDFCAWTEVYLSDRWYTFDPRNHGQRRVGRTVIGRGRDAADVAMTTTFGAADLVAMTVTAEGDDEEDPVR